MVRAILSIPARIVWWYALRQLHKLGREMRHGEAALESVEEAIRQIRDLEPD